MPPATKQSLHRWPPRSPDLTPSDFCLMDYVKDCVFLLPLPHDLPELRRWIVASISEISRDLLQRVWAEMDYRIDVWPVTKCGHTQQLWGTRDEFGEFLFPPTGRILQSFPPLKFTDFMKRIRELLMTLMTSQWLLIYFYSYGKTAYWTLFVLFFSDCNVTRPSFGLLLTSIILSLTSQGSDYA
jgi:hypothetical protein